MFSHPETFPFCGIIHAMVLTSRSLLYMLGMSSLSPLNSIQSDSSFPARTTAVSSLCHPDVTHLCSHVTYRPPLTFHRDVLKHLNFKESGCYELQSLVSCCYSLPQSCLYSLFVWWLGVCLFVCLLLCVCMCYFCFVYTVSGHGITVTCWNKLTCQCDVPCH